MVVREGNQNLTKAYCGLHIVLCTLYIISFGKFMINVNCVKDERVSNMWPTDILGI